MTSRRVLLVVTLLFIAGLTALTVLDMVRNGVNALSVVSFVILLFFWVAIGGALRDSDRRR
ncbi:MAG TPA: hypothetical protein VG405_05715 [Solirubrobacteraceae bacterium]|nr:hypothetical protein [Solirubrobacteraceae bacterium]